MKLREWIGQLNVCKAQNQQLHAKLASVVEQLEERDNQVSELSAEYLINHQNSYIQKSMLNFFHSCRCSLLRAEAQNKTYEVEGRERPDELQSYTSNGHDEDDDLNVEFQLHNVTLENATLKKNLEDKSLELSAARGEYARLGNKMKGYVPCYPPVAKHN